MTRYADKKVNPDFYGRVSVLDLSPEGPPVPREVEVLVEDFEPEVDFSGRVKPKYRIEKRERAFAEEFQPSYVYAPYVPVVKTPNINPEDFRRPGRFPLLTKLRDIAVPPPGTLVRSVTGRKQFGIVGKRGDSVGVFWSVDGWVGDYRAGELKEMFDSCLEIDRWWSVP